MPRVTDCQNHKTDLNALPHGGLRGCARGTVAWFAKALVFLSCLTTGCASHVLHSGTPESVGMESSVLGEVDSIAKQEIDSGNIPGCVVLVARKGTIVRHKAYGDRAVSPEKATNSVSTIYDLASLTKAVATTTAIALLLDDGKLNLNNKVIDYLPSFGAEGKDDVTLAHLLTHTSGLKPYLDMSLIEKEYGPGPNPDAIIQHICSLPKTYETGKSSVYSCLNFVILARIAEEVSGEPMHRFLRRRVWLPLGMKEPRFFPNDEQTKRAAPTHPDGSEDYRGRVHDPLARYYITPEHACGNAGLFSTAHDLAIFAQMLLNRGEYGGVRILKPETVDLLTTVQTLPELPKRGLGWDIDSPYAPWARGDVIPPDESFGHTGFTGTSLWLDRKSQTFFIILSNRTHIEKGDVAELRRGIANVVGRSLDIYREKPAPRSLTLDP
ncbi:MAG: serine hydrolase [bacterium]|nr:serine hydrolase [bacterium]